MTTFIDNSAWLQIRGLGKQFGGISALRDVDLNIHHGEVHGLVGANGAGKSTLIRCLAGVEVADEGQILIDGHDRRIENPDDSRHLGFAFIHQELNLIPRFSSIQNILLGAPKEKRAGFVDWKESRKAAIAAADRIGVDFSLDTPVSELSVAERWLIMISRALVHRATLIAMDEPTASLSVNESARLFKIINDLSEDGVAILYVSHRLDEVLELSNRITVFRDGKVVRTGPRNEWDKKSLIHEIVGHDLVTGGRPRARMLNSNDAPVLEARNISRGHVVRDVSLRVFSGEILGLGGVVGAGRTEFIRMIFGADQPDSGSFEIDGNPFRASSVHDAIANGVGLVPEERRSEGLLLSKSVMFNMNMTVLRSLRTVPRLPFLNETKKKERAARIIDQLKIKTPTALTPVGSLSGGNQQKVLFAHWLTPGIKVLLLDEPSRGVDVGAREEIYGAIRDLADAGVAIILVSSEAEELAMLCHRIVVFRQGSVVGELMGEGITERRIIEMGFGIAPTREEGNAST
jgi:ribose transport system ATP-binding protein